MTPFLCDSWALFWSYWLEYFLLRDAYAKHYANRDICYVLMSVRPSVRPSQVGILSKRLNVSSSYLWLILQLGILKNNGTSLWNVTHFLNLNFLWKLHGSPWRLHRIPREKLRGIFMRREQKHVKTFLLEVHTQIRLATASESPWNPLESPRSFHMFLLTCMASLWCFVVCSYLGDEANGGHCRKQRADNQDDSSRANHLHHFPDHPLHQWVCLRLA